MPPTRDEAAKRSEITAPEGAGRRCIASMVISEVREMRGVHMRCGHYERVMMQDGEHDCSSRFCDGVDGIRDAGRGGESHLGCHSEAG